MDDLIDWTEAVPKYDPTPPDAAWLAKADALDGIPHRWPADVLRQEREGRERAFREAAERNGSEAEMNAPSRRPGRRPRFMVCREIPGHICTIQEFVSLRRAAGELLTYYQVLKALEHGKTVKGWHVNWYGHAGRGNGRANSRV